LAIFGGLLAKLALRPSPAVYQQDDLYINRRLGLAFSRPAEWNFVRLSEMGEMQQGQILAVDDPEQNQAILSSLDLPFVALSPEQLFQGAETLGIQFYVAEPPSTGDVVSVILHETFGKEYRGTAESRFSPPMQVVRRDWQISRGLLDSFRVRSLPVDLATSSCPAAEYTATYKFRHRDLPEPRTIRVRTVAVQHHLRFYLLRLIDTEEFPFDFSPFLETLRFA
jgi:hypothetical protein